MKKIYLIRHAQSNANVDFTHLREIPNPNVDLTEIGYLQANQSGKFLNKNLKLEETEKLVIWTSPYYRTRQTAKVILNNIEHQNISKRESIYLAERQFGLVEEVEDYQNKYPDHVNHYNFYKNNNVDFFARPPLGESPFDLALRVDNFIKTEINTSPYSNHIIVSHGAAIKAIILMCLRLEYETYQNFINPNNASIILLTKENNSDEWTSSNTIFTPDFIT